MTSRTSAGTFSRCSKRMNKFCRRPSSQVCGALWIAPNGSPCLGGTGHSIGSCCSGCQRMKPFSMFIQNQSIMRAVTPSCDQSMWVPRASWETLCSMCMQSLSEVHLVAALQAEHLPGFGGRGDLVAQLLEDVADLAHLGRVARRRPAPD